MYHLSAIYRAYTFWKNYVNPEAGVANKLSNISSSNFSLNSEILPPIIEAVIKCA